MDAWAILGLSETADMDAVRQAYHKQIVLHNPEDDAEGFIRVRAAYETITAALTCTDKKQDETPSERFIRRVEAVYDDFETRIDPAAWTALLDDEAYIRLDTEEEANKQLIQFLMQQHHYLPKAVWRLLNTRFDWSANVHLLKNDFPANLIDFIIDSADNNPIDYTLFTRFVADGAVMDRWIHRFFDLQAAVLGYEPKYDEIIDRYIREITAMPVSHPYLTLLLARLALERHHKDEAFTMIEALRAQYPTDTKVRFHYALVLGAFDRHEEAASIFEELLDENPTDLGAKKGLIESAVMLGNYEGARFLLFEILETDPSNLFALQFLDYITPKLIAFYEAEHAAAPEDSEIALRLAKHYINDNRYDDCRALLESLPDRETDERISEYLADCYVSVNNYELALAYYRVNIGRVKKYRNYVKIVHVLLHTEDYKNVLAKVTEALELNDEDAVSEAFLYDCRGRALHALERYDEALAAFDDGLRANANLPQIYVHKAITCRRLHRAAEAVDLCEQSIDIFPYNTDAYVQIMEIFYEADLYDRMVALADRAADSGHDSPKVLYYKACALRMQDKLDEAEAILDALLTDEYDEGYRDYFYSELAYICVNRRDYAGALRNMEEAVRLNGEPVYRQGFLANVHRLRGAFDEALALYDTLIKTYPRMISAWMGRGNVYFDTRAYERARSDFDRVLVLVPGYEAAYDRIIDAYLAENRHADALPTTEQEVTLFPSEDNYLRLAWLYDKVDKTDDADALYQKICDLFPESDRVYRSYGYYKKKRGMYAQAVTLFNRSLEKADQQPLLYAEIGFCLASLDRSEEALAIVNKGLSLFPDAGDLYIRRAMIDKQMFNLQGMLADMLLGIARTESLDDRWNLTVIYNIIGDLHETVRNDVANAILYYRKSIEADDRFLPSRRNLGELYCCCGRYAEALAVCNEAVALANDDPGVYVARAQVYAQMKRCWAAKRDYRKALALYQLDESQGDAGMLDQMAICYEGLRNPQAAIACYERALAAAEAGDPRDKRRLAENMYRRGYIEVLRKNPDGALAYYNEAIKLLDAARFHAAKAALTEQRG